MAPSSHSRIGASSCERWWNCPGSVAMSKNIPPQPSSKFAAEGSAAHQLVEDLLTKGVGSDVYEIDDFEIQVDAKMEEHAETFVEWVRKEAQGNTLHVEKKFHLSHIHKDAFGTCDIVISQPYGLLKIVDFKYGQGVVVDPYRNKQLMYYAVGASYGGDYSEIEMIIYQPRGRGETVKRWLCDKTELSQFAAELHGNILETEKIGAALKVGTWCKWCPANVPAQGAQCPALLKEAQLTAVKEFENAGVEPPRVDLMPKDQLERVLKMKPAIEDFLKKAEGYAHAKAEDGEIYENFKIVAKRAMTKWGDEIGFIAAHGKKEVYTKKLRTPKQMEDVLSKNEIAEYTIKEPSGTVLVPREDKRKELKPESEFKYVKGV